MVAKLAAATSEFHQSRTVKTKPIDWSSSTTVEIAHKVTTLKNLVKTSCVRITMAALPLKEETRCTFIPQISREIRFTTMVLSELESFSFMSWEEATPFMEGQMDSCTSTKPLTCPILTISSRQLNSTNTVKLILSSRTNMVLRSWWNGRTLRKERPRALPIRHFLLRFLSQLVTSCSRVNLPLSRPLPSHPIRIHSFITSQMKLLDR